LTFDIDKENLNLILDSTQQLKKHLSTFVSVRKELAGSLIELSHSKKPSPWFQSNLLFLMEKFRESAYQSVNPYSNIINVLKKKQKFTSDINNEIIKIIPRYRFGLIPSYDFDLLLSAGLSTVEVAELIELPLYHKNLLTRLIKEIGIVGIMELGREDLSKLIGTEKAPAEKELNRYWKWPSLPKRPEWLKKPNLPDWFNRENAWKAIKIIGGGASVGGNIVLAATGVGLVAIPSIGAGAGLIADGTLKKEKKDEESDEGDDPLTILNKRLAKGEISTEKYRKLKKEMGIL